MGAPTKRDSGGTPPLEHELNEPTAESAEQHAPEYVVARGRSVRVGGKTLSPGHPVALSEADTEHLLAAGFIVSTNADVNSRGGVTVGGLQIRGGRKPGASVA